ncbi:hypothetical protein DL766_008510 [Monosporascus sp. MC13-8B]|uniref:LEM-like domain-containing protein n=1 Tax=Monosporascus cannonballus TaxID=155416 RepID=A0ABY0H348_9PEZI|nr:hypothetical protein DL762_006043 [Monosporascus cannonballus]RYP19158.1 hypothetical protein DL766_008510 [Monosporascus sp. MC13-8B]
MSDSDSLDYLEPGFDPKSLTVPRLRSILVAHNIEYPSSAKKAQLIEIFNEQLVPQSKRILAARARAKRSSKGIFDVESSQDNHPFADHEDLPPPPPRPASTRRSRSPRKTAARIKSEEPDHNEPLPPPAPSISRRTPRASSRPLQVSDLDTGPDADVSASVRRTRRPEAPPQFKAEVSNDGLFRRTSDVFTNDNPFQSGSSPSVPEITPSNRRKTTAITPARSAVTPVPRRADGHAAARVDMLTTPIAVKEDPEPLPVEAGEEFTPEEQLELAAEEAMSGETSTVRSRRPAKSSPLNWSSPLSVLFVTLLAVYAGWYRQEKIAVGYCGVGRSESSIPSEISVPEWAHSVLPPEVSVPESFIAAVEPQCEPCPPHAYCYADYSVRCEQDYILKPHPFSLGGVVPLPPTCEPDGEKVRRVQAVADRAVEELRQRTAKYECGEPVTEEGTKLETPAMKQEELKQIINQKRSKKMSNQEFEDLWGSALGEIKAREEVEVEEVRDSGSVSNTYLSSTSLARVPITCAVRRSIRLGLARHRLQISAVIGLVLAALYGRRRIRSNRALAAQVPALVDLVLERLANQRRLGDADADDPWLFLPNLRDDVLRSVHSLRQRERIWQRVRKVVEQNSNVRTSQREGRSGEVGRAWEWIGPTTTAVVGEGARSSRRSGGGRVSWGPDAAVKTEEGMDEPRPVY